MGSRHGKTIHRISSGWEERASLVAVEVVVLLKVNSMVVERR